MNNTATALAAKWRSEADRLDREPFTPFISGAAKKLQQCADELEAMTTPHAKSNAREGDGVAVPLPQKVVFPFSWDERPRMGFTAEQMLAYADARVAAAMQAQQGAEPVAEDEDGMPVGYADWYNRKFAGQCADTRRDHDCEEAWRAGIRSATGAPR